ncbi:hypothetical protein AVEN_274739-1 [Araneus ventricosus]|uniref:Uncharacterized protein n=1 Tax=Araneus ventricosus TaxID=182803 RepID=A0A4Y2RNX8_ARAVE|nr:hypothetical protein AVEN_274739-1 [Araneus ventricosus]
MDPKITASLNRLRGALRQNVTRLENCMKQSASGDKVILETKLVETIRKKLFEFQKLYYELPPEAGLTKSDEAIEKMETCLEEMEVSLKYLISKHNIDDTIAKLNIKENKTEKLLSVKLPDIPLSQFSAKYEEFGNFKSQFISLIYTYKRQCLSVLCVCVCLRCPDESIALTAMKFDTEVVVMVTECTSKPKF